MYGSRSIVSSGSRTESMEKCTVRYDSVRIAHSAYEVVAATRKSCKLWIIVKRNKIGMVVAGGPPFSIFIIIKRNPFPSVIH